MRWLRRLYQWVLHWAETPYGTPALFLLAFSESSFFPVPPDLLLIALAISIPARAFWYSSVCSVASVLGGAFGYLIGLEFMDLVGFKIIEFYGAMDKFEYVRELFIKYDFWAIFTAGFTPIPYKVFTIAAGAFDMSFPKFCLASLLSRSARFFLVGALIWKFGEPIKGFIDRYFNLLSLLFVILLIGGFLVIKMLIQY